MREDELRVCFVSDNHGIEFDAAPADALIHTGDLTMHGYMDEVVRGLRWLDRQPHALKAYLPGNHDGRMEEPDVVEAMRLLFPNITFLQPGMNTLGPLGVAALPYMNLPGWAFYTPPEASSFGVHRLIASGGKPEVLVTHSPPKGVLDFVPDRIGRDGTPRPGGNAGMQVYAGLAKRIGAQVHAFGHIHEQGGETAEVDGVLHVNAAVLDRTYRNLTHMGMVTTVRTNAWT